MLLAVLGITGAPGLNGYASKSLLHHGISLAAETGPGWLSWVEGLFLLVGVGTTASFAKLYYLIFLGKPSKLKVKEGKIPSFQLAMILLAMAMLWIGIRPEWLLNLAIGPAVQALGIDNALATLKDISFWNFKDIKDMIITLILGVLVCWGGLKSGAFHWHPPAFLTLEGLAKILIGKISALGERFLKTYHLLVSSVNDTRLKLGLRLFAGLRKFDELKSATVLGIEFADINADVAILTFILGLLIAWFALANFGHKIF